MEMKNKITDQESGLMRVPEAAHFIRYKVSTLRSWILKRKIRYVKLGGRVFIRKVDLEELIAKSVVEASIGG